MAIGDSSVSHSRRRVDVRFALGELALWAACYVVYLVTRASAISSEAAARDHADRLVRLERSLGLARERAVQGLVDSPHALRALAANAYELGFFPAVIAAGVVLAFRHREAYRRLRTGLLVALAGASVVFWCYPTAPPRLVPGLGLADLVGMGDHDVGSFHGIDYNPYAAMPSMHVGWTLLVALAFARAAGGVPRHWPWLAYPCGIAFVVVATGNHYLLDCVAGAAVALAADGVAGRWARADHRELRHVWARRTARALAGVGSAYVPVAALTPEDVRATPSSRGRAGR
jgi:hypothetical protein